MPVHRPARLLLLLALASPAFAQEMEPRAYSPSPVGLTFILLGFGRSAGDVVFDPNIPITNVTAHLNAPLFALGHTFGLFGRQALVTAALPYVWGDAEGNVKETRTRITRSGLADLKAKLSINLHGSPARTPREFAADYRRTFIVAASLAVSAPTGQYDPAKLINLGTNRWGFKPEIGFSCPVKKFDLDLYLAARFFTRNSEFFPGNAIRTQDPIPSMQAHVSYTLRPRMWLAADGTWYGGGAARVVGSLSSSSSSSKNSSRAGLTLALPLTARQSLKLEYSRNTFGQTGTRFNTLGVGWQFVFMKVE
jgi:hypothetical protein